MLSKNVSSLLPADTHSRRGAIGKAFIVWLASGSIGLAVVAYLIFAGIGC